MKKIILIASVFAFCVLEARTCTKGCYNSSGGYGVGMGWSVPNGTACTGNPPSGTTVYYAYATSDGVYDTGVVDGWSVGMSVGC